MDQKPENPSEPVDENSPPNELVLDNWKLLLVFFVALVICIIFFAAGLIVGRHQPRVADTNQVAQEDLGRSRTTSAVPLTINRPRTTLSAPKETVVEMQRGPVPAQEPARESKLPAEAAENVIPSTTLAVASEPKKLEETESPPVSQPKTNPALRDSVKAESAPAAFRVQIAAMKTDAEAQAVVEKLKKKGFEAFVVAPKNNSDTYYRVQMGDYTDRAAAQEMILKLQQAGEKPVLKRQ